MALWWHVATAGGCSDTTAASSTTYGKWLRPVLHEGGRQVKRVDRARGAGDGVSDALCLGDGSAGHHAAAKDRR